MPRKRKTTSRTPRTSYFGGGGDDGVDDDWEVLAALETAIDADERPVVDAATSTRTLVGSAWRVQVASWGADRARLQRGLQYLAEGAVDELLVERGRVKAVVHGSRNYTVQIVVGLPSARAAEPLATRLRGTSGAAAIAALTEAMRAEGMSLLHDTVRRMVVTCSCPDDAGCKHAVAVVHGFATSLDRDPALLLTLWGLDDLVATGGEFVVAPLAPDHQRLHEDLGALFGIDLIAPPPPPAPGRTPPSAHPEVERGYLRVLGIPARMIDVWLREGLLQSVGRPDTYARTTELNRRIAEYLAR